MKAILEKLSIFTINFLNKLVREGGGGPIPDKEESED